MTGHPPTPEQQAIFADAAAGHNLMIQSYAGTGKSTTIVGALAHIPPSEPTLVLAFNKDARQDVEAKINAAGHARGNLHVKTFNALGAAALNSPLRRPELDDDKIFKLAKDQGFAGDDLADVLHLVRTARSEGLVPRPYGRGLVEDTPDYWHDLAASEDCPEYCALPAREILKDSTRLALRGIIDFQDQIYISTLIIGDYQRRLVVIVDEAQDLEPLNHLQVRKTLRSDTQLICVGDIHQAIYAFRGADAQSFLRLRDLRKHWTDRRLSVTFRCSQAIVARQQGVAPGFTAAPGNPAGSVAALDSWTPQPGAAILCRNNAPLVRCAFRLLRAGQSVNFLGRDIGRSLVRLYNKVSAKGSRDLGQVLDTLKQMLDREDAGTPDHDKIDTLLAILESGQRSVPAAIDRLSSPQPDAVTLSTGHKAKGLEWPMVYHLEPNLIPAPYATTLEALTQETNLRYVIETRSSDALRLVRLEGLAL